MAFIGHMDSDGEIVLTDEIYSGRTRISSISTSSEQSEQSEHMMHSERSMDYLPSERWEPSETENTSNLLYKPEEESSSSSSAPLSLPTANGNSYTISKGHENSLYSFSEMCGSINQMETQSSVVSSLGLSSKTGTLDYMRDLEGLKLDRDPQVAYEAWVASKQLLRQRALQLQKEQREKEIERHEQRKQLAKQCYEQWLRNKAEQAAQLRMENHMQQAALQAENAVASRSRTNKKSVRNVSQSEIRQVVQSWWLKKQEQQQRLHREKQHRLLKKSLEEQRRKQLAEKAFQKWMSNVYDKPKPVPMNQGIDSLRGTVSDIYINPLPWQSLKTAQK